MPDPLNIYIGWDSKEPVAFSVLAHSILSRATIPVNITPLTRKHLEATGTYTRKREAKESTEFSMTRFLVPYLSGYHGYSVFMDCDMLCRVDLRELRTLIYGVDPEKLSPYRADTFLRAEAVLVCKHDYTPRDATKFLGQPQTAYPRKNWSSFVVFNNAACRALTPEYVNHATGLELHRFQWLDDQRIGSLPLEWNHLVGEYPYSNAAKVVHWTNGGPWFPEYAESDYSDEWRHEWGTMVAPLETSCISPQIVVN